MIITTFLRIFLGRKFSPFVFKTEKDFIPKMPQTSYGLYVHIPFCKTICPFCPYYKVLYNKDEMDSYIDSLLKEIALVGKRLEGHNIRINTVYFGGGTPALAGERLVEINKTIDKYFTVSGSRGIELNPDDVDKNLINILKESNIDMVSVGIQTFSTKLNQNLGRENKDPRETLDLLCKNNFSVIDVDLIFGIKGQTKDDIIEDFSTAAKLGATQISTYPFIDFSYSNNVTKPLGLRKKRELLQGLLSISRDLGYKRNSVWTFIKQGTDKYSSVTRDNFLGFGASATTLGMDSFKINIFSVKEYINCIEHGEIPSNLTLKFNKRTRTLYWLFWSIYNGEISRTNYKELFGSEIKKDYGITLFMGIFLGFWKKIGGVYILTIRGSYIFHLAEQHYTHKYIDKTWRSSLEDPWKKELKLY